MTGNLKVTIDDLNIILQSLSALTIKGSDAVKLGSLIAKVEKCGDDLSKKIEAKVEKDLIVEDSSK